MSRVIRFRGKRSINDEWVYGSLLVWPNGRTYILESENNGNTAWECEIDPDTVGQFTGLHDANGKEIYEGDILRISVSQNGIAEVKWNTKCAMFVEQMKNSSQWYNLEGRKEIIGNIHDNPELLKGEKQ